MPQPAWPHLPEPMRAAIDRAIDIVLTHGDSFELPPSFEIAVIRGRRADVAELVAALYLGYPDGPGGESLVGDVVLTPVGHTGFRPITQLDPIWNLYLLALVIAAGPDIERSRVPVGQGVVHSFRFVPRVGAAHLFDPDFGWHSFCDAGRERATGYAYVLMTDICSFSQSISCRRLERALREACVDPGIVDRIMHVVRRLTGDVSSGLPVGAPAFSLLAELVLDATDRLLLANDIAFIRYIDDFRIFAQSRDEAQRLLELVGARLTTHTGFSLQKAKTRILSSGEFLSRLPVPAQSTEVVGGGGEKEFLRLRIHVDRYAGKADTAITDAIRRSVQSFDVAGLLAAELRKPQISESLAKRAVRSMAHLDARRRAELMALFGSHLERFAPVFRGVLQSFLEHADALDDDTRSGFSDAVKALHFSRSHVMQVPANQSWAIRVIARDFDERSERILADMYRSTDSASIRRDIIIAMSNGGRIRFISDARQRFAVLNAWDRRAVLVASHMREDPEPCWLHESALTGFEQVVRAWAVDERSRSGGSARIPL